MIVRSGKPSTRRGQGEILRRRESERGPVTEDGGQKEDEKKGREKSYSSFIIVSVSFANSTETDTH